MYGTVVINDGIQAEGGKPLKHGTFVVDLNYREAKYVYLEGGTQPTNAQVDYSRQYNRLAPQRGVMAAVKSFVSQYSGCAEAHKLRKRMIALDRIRNTISGEQFRFPIGCEE